MPICLQSMIFSLVILRFRHAPNKETFKISLNIGMYSTDFFCLIYTKYIYHFITLLLKKSCSFEKIFID